MNPTQVISIFSEYADPQKAEAMEAYMKNQFDFFGIKSPERRSISKHVMQEARSEARFDADFFRALWRDPHREMQYVAQEYIYYTRKWWAGDEYPQLLYALTHKSWWDTVDYLASTVMGYMYRTDVPKYHPVIKSWAVSKDMWLRRSSIIYQLKYGKDTDTEMLDFVINENLGSDEFFINKAIGWALRQYSKTNPEWVQEYVDSHQLTTLSRREATKYI